MKDDLITPEEMGEALDPLVSEGKKRSLEEKITDKGNEALSKSEKLNKSYLHALKIGE